MRLPPPHYPPTRRASPGNSLAPILIIVAALGISTAIFFLYTKKKIGQETAPVASADTVSESPDAPGTPASKPSATAPETAPTATPATKPPPAPKTTYGFARPLDLGKQMASSLAAGDFGAAGGLASAADPAQSDMAAQMFQKLAELGYKPGTEDQVELLGLVENRTRLSLPLTRPGMDGTARLQLDVERDERMGWKIAKIILPKDASAALAAIETSLPAPTATVAAATPPAMAAGKSGSPPPAPTTPLGSAPPTTVAKATPSLFAIEESQDALSFASDFVQALLRHDFTAAQKFVDVAKVPVERLLGLCIVFEEGEYQLKPSKPLIVTIANPEVSWVIAQVESESLQQTTEFGLELKRGSTSESWKVASVNLSQLLGSFAQNASKLGIPYTPIVQNPKGGESLALYFEYDEAQLHPRALKQLEVVASMLKADPAKKLRITGHTDARGDDTYNVRLSQNRAESVKQQLVALGVPNSQVETTGLGKAQPLGPNEKADGTDNPEGRSRNRRAEIFLDF